MVSLWFDECACHSFALKYKISFKHLNSELISYSYRGILKLHTTLKGFKNSTSTIPCASVQICMCIHSDKSNGTLSCSCYNLFHNLWCMICLSLFLCTYIYNYNIFCTLYILKFGQIYIYINIYFLAVSMYDLLFNFLSELFCNKQAMLTNMQKMFI